MFDKLFYTREKVLGEIYEVVANARERIEHALATDGPYTHNMLSATLRGVSEKIGYKYANDLVIAYQLTELYDIPEVTDETA